MQSLMFQSEKGPFTLLKGDDVYDFFIAQTRDVEVVNNDVVLPDGSQIVSMAFSKQVICTLLYPDGAVNHVNYLIFNNLTAMGVSIIEGTFDNSDSSQVTTYYSITNEDTKNIKFNHRRISDIRAQTSIYLNVISSGATYSGGTYPYGGGDVYTVSDSVLTLFRIGIMVCNESMQNFVRITFTALPASGGSTGKVSYSQSIPNSSQQEFLRNFFNGLEPFNPEPEETDPFNRNDHSTSGGGQGAFSRTGDNIDFPSLPTLSAVDAGFISLYAPTAAQLKSLASYMWTGLFDIDSFRKIFANPMECILGMSIVPVDLTTSGSETVKVGNISTGVSMSKVSSQYVEIDCGMRQIGEYWGAYLDYDPYTKCEIYLPYIGIHQLAVDDVMGKYIRVKYHIDVLSGACTAFVKCGDSVLYSFNGQCSCSIPITGNDWTNVINGVLGVAGSIGAMVATGGLSAPLSTAAGASALKTIASSAQNVTSSKPNVERSGSLSGMGGMLGIQTPYLILTYPKQCVPSYQNSFTGYPSYITKLLSEIWGYNEIAEIHIENVHATKDEIMEIERILKEGAIF